MMASEHDKQGSLGEGEVVVGEDLGMLYDSEVLRLQQFKRWMDNRFRGRVTKIQDWCEEVIERLAKTGFHAEVRLQTDENYTGDETRRMWYPAILLLSRVEAEEEFDHDKMRHEVRSNIRGLNQQGDVQAKAVQAGFSKGSSGLYVPGKG